MLASFSAPLLALSLLTAHAQPFSLTVSPAKSAVAVGQTSKIRVYDTGTAPLSLTVTEHEVSRVRGKCTFSPARVPYVSLSRTRFRLHPKGEVTVRVHVLRGASPGKHTLATVVAAPMGQRGSVRISGAAAALMLLTVPGQVTVKPQRPCVSLVPASSPGRTPWLLMFAAALAVLALAFAAWRIVRRRRRPAYGDQGGWS